MENNLYRKAIVLAVISIFVLISLSPVYAGVGFSDSKSVYFDDIKPTKIDNENAIVKKSLIDRYNSYKEYPGHPYTDHSLLREPTFVDGEHWDIIVPDDYPTIQEAVDHADRGYRILVRSGAYYENVVIDVQSLTLHGEDRDSTIIDAGGNNHVIRVTSETDGVNISGFTLRNSGSGNAGLNVSSHYNLIQDTIITGNGDGIRLYLSGGNQIEGNQILNNQGDGLWLYHSNGNNFIDNTIKENGDNGVEFTYSSLGTTIEGNTISDNVNCGIFLKESSLGNTIIGNDISGNDFGVNCVGVSDGNIFHHNNFIENTQNAFDSSFDLWDDGSEGNYWDDYTGEDNDGDGIGDTPYVIPGDDNKDRFPLMNPALTIEKPLKKEAIKETNRYFKDEKPVIKGCSTNNEWDFIVPDDYPTIQEAINHSSDGYRILVRSDDVYYENVVINVKDLTLHGENKDTTVIDGTGNPAHIVSIAAPGANVSGFTIRDTGEEYAGISIYANSNIFQDNIITDCDFGIRLFYYDDNTVVGNTLTGNKFGIVVWMSKGNHINDNKIENSVEDGVVFLEKSSVDLQQNIIENNTFNGVLMIGCSNVHIKETSLQFNGWFGIQMFSSDDNMIEENPITSNSNDGISIHKSINNLFSGNNLLSNHNVGISFWYHSNNNYIDSNEIELNFFQGLFLYYSNFNIIHNNNITNNTQGGMGIIGDIALDTCNNNKINGNTITNILFNGIGLLSSRSNNITGNTIKSGSGIGLFYSMDNHISENSISENPYGNTGIGIFTIFSDYNCINNNIINNIEIGVDLGYSENNSINSNTVTNTIRDGLQIYHSINNSISSNSITNSTFSGISSFNDKNNIINDNTITNNNYGIELEGDSINNIIIGNNITNNNDQGLVIRDWSDNNIIYHNNFIDNHPNAYDPSSNIWDAGYPYGGNYWDDYTGEDNNGDGIGDTPYPIPGDDNQDRYPLMEPWSGENNPPEPPTIKGQTSGKPGTEYEYVFSTTDPEGDIVWYWIDWDDNSVEEWIGPYFPGEEVTISHTWEEKGIYTIRCKAKDVFGEESDWGELTVTMPRNKIAHTTLSLRLLERFPLRFIEWLLYHSVF